MMLSLQNNRWYTPTAGNRGDINEISGLCEKAGKSKDPG
jgi:hypothetical protein